MLLHSMFGVRCSMFDVCFRKMDLFRRNVYRIVGLIVGGIFIYAGVIKVMDPIGFARDIDNYHMLPWALSVRLAFYLPWLEVFCGLGILCGLFYRGGLLILNALICIFIIASIVAKARGLDITCGCFGHASKNLSFAWHLAIDFALLATTTVLWFSNRTPLEHANAMTNDE
jgi:putative oxidoreductase